jgi:predicted ATPase with chaperone activity
MVATAPPPGSTQRFFPPRVTSIEDTGFDITFLADLAVKIVYYAGVSTGGAIANAMRLPFFNVVDKVLDGLKNQRFIEVRGSTSPIGSMYQYNLTDRGEEKVQELLKRSAYHGPCPVSMEDYVYACSRQSLRNVTITREQILEAFSSMVMSKQMLDQLGPAINSGTSIFLFGPPGNGKTTIAEVASTCLGGDIYIPHAVLAEGQYIHVFDELVHKAVPDADYEGVDERWVLSKRPVVVAGGELSMAALDLTWSDEGKVYQAPLQMKANCGLFLIDDFGRQQITPTELLNRWIIPLEKRVDYLNLVTGGKVKTPFDQLIIFSTNLEPRDLVDDAFLRRIRYKIMVNPPTPDEYREIFRRVAKAKNIVYSDKAIDYMFVEYYQKQGLQLRNCHARDLLDQLTDFARYLRVPAEMSKQLIDLACQSYFVKL